MSTVWAAGDYHRFATELIWHFGPELVADTKIARGMRVLDVATGSGNVALRAAERGAVVTACDVTPEQLALGRREARGARSRDRMGRGRRATAPVRRRRLRRRHLGRGRDLRPRPPGRRGRAQTRLPPGRHDRDDQLHARRSRRGLLRRLRARTDPRRATRRCCGAARPTSRELFAGLELDLRRRDYVERVPGGPQGFVDFYRETFGPAAVIEDDRFEQDFRAFAERANEGAPGGDAELRFEYLRVLARLPAHPAAA